MPLQVNQLHCGDARDLLLDVEPDSIACSFWSPPYHVGTEYEAGQSYEEWTSLLRTVIRNQFAVTRPGGFLVINIADILVFRDPLMPRIQAENVSRQRSPITREQVIEAKRKHPHLNRNELAALLGCSEQTVDRRLNGNNIRGGKYSTQTRVHLVGDLIEDAGQQSGFFLYDRRIWVKDPAWQNSQWHTLSYRAIDEFEYLYVLWKPGISRVDREKLSRREWADWGSRAVWTIPSVRANDDHEAKFPVELATRVIRLFSEPDDIVLDCFMGSGTTAIAAVRTNRRFIGIELLQKYVDLSKRRLARESAQGHTLFEQSRHQPGDAVQLKLGTK
jgi:site-specific DNA-methyltransferase (adenine-specific)